MTCSLLHLRYIQALLSLPVFIAASIFISGDKTNSCEGQFLIFLPIFTYFVLSYFVFAPQRFQKTWALLILEGLTWFFWFGGFAALAAQEVNYDSGSKRTRNAMKATAIVSGIQSLTWFVSLGVVITQAVQRRKAARRQAHADQLAGQTKGEVAV